MKLSKKGKKGIRVKKLANGGNSNGDPVKEAKATPPKIVYLDSDEDAIVAPGTQVVLIDKDAEQESFLPYDMPASGRIESLPLVDLAIALGAYAAPAAGSTIWSGLTGLGEMGYGALSGPFSTLLRSPLSNPVTGAPIAGGSITGIGLIDSYFASHGATNLPGDIVDFYYDPSWENAGSIGMDVLEMLPVTIDYLLPSASPAVEGYASASSKTKGTPMAFTSAGESTGILTKATEATGAVKSHVYNQVKNIKDGESAGAYTAEQAQAQIAKILAYNEEKFKSPAFLEKLVEAQKVAYGQSTGIKNADVTPFGYIEFLPDGAAAYGLFSTPEQAAVEMVKAMKSGDDVLRNAIIRTKGEVHTMAPNVGGRYSQGPRNVEYAQEVVGGIPTGRVGRNPGYSEYAAEFGIAFEGAYMEINLEAAKSMDDLLYIIGHETDHNFAIPFMKYTLNNYAIGKYTHIDDIVVPMRETVKGDYVPDRILNATELKPGSFYDNYVNARVRGSAGSGKYDSSIRDNIIGELAYLNEPAEVSARLEEMKITWWNNVGIKSGQSMDEWLYNFTPEKAKKALELWTDSGGDRGFVQILKGRTADERANSLASLLNSVLTPGVPIGIGSAVATQANITEEETPTINKRGGFISRKKRRKGYRAI